MKRELYQCSKILTDVKSNTPITRNVYFDTLRDAKEYARNHNVETITRIVGDMEIAERYEWSSRKIERKVIEVTWDWFTKEGEE